MEPMGAETYLYLDTGIGSSCIARVDAHREADVGDELSLALMMPKAHIFDAKTEKLVV
jgi:multiple sugar transport system ATP-binding protein